MTAGTNEANRDTGPGVETGNFLKNFLERAAAVVGVLFLALAYPLVMFARQDPAVSMMFSLYVTLGVFLLSQYATQRRIAA